MLIVQNKMTKYKIIYEQKKEKELVGVVEIVCGLFLLLLIYEAITSTPTIIEKEMSNYGLVILIVGFASVGYIIIMLISKGISILNDTNNYGKVVKYFFFGVHGKIIGIEEIKENIDKQETAQRGKVLFTEQNDKRKSNI